MVPVCEVPQDGDRHGPGADLHVGQRTLPRSDAVEPVAMVARRLLEVDFLCFQGFLDEADRVAGEVVAVNITGFRWSR